MLLVSILAVVGLGKDRLMPDRRSRWVLAVLSALLLAPVSASRADIEFSVGSAPTPFPQNKQNEPALAVDASHPRVLAAGANDLIDVEAFGAGDPKTCPFTQGVATSGVYCLFGGSASWIHPTYAGWTARHCLGPTSCVPFNRPD